MGIPFLVPYTLPALPQASLLHLHPKRTLEGANYGMDSHILREDVMDLLESYFSVDFWRSHCLLILA